MEGADQSLPAGAFFVWTFTKKLVRSGFQAFNSEAQLGSFMRLSARVWWQKSTALVFYVSQNTYIGPACPARSRRNCRPSPPRLPRDGTSPGLSSERTYTNFNARSPAMARSPT